MPRELKNPKWPLAVDISTPVAGSLSHVNDQGQANAIEDRGGQLCGHVLANDVAPSEPPDFSLSRVLARVCWLGVAVLAPFVAAHWLFVNGSGFSALVTLAILWLALRWLTPNSLLSLMQLNFLLNPAARRHQELLPVRFFRVRDATGAESMVRMKGRFTHGNIMAGDLVTFHGFWRGGVLDARRAWSHRTRSTVDLDQGSARLAFGLACAALLLLSIYFIHAFSNYHFATPTAGGTPW